MNDEMGSIQHDPRVALEARIREVETALEASRQEAKPVSLDESIGRLTRVDALQQQHMASARKERLETQLTQIRQALGRVDAGTYGECVKCGEPIADKRLEARPEAPFCVECQGGGPAR